MNVPIFHVDPGLNSETEVRVENNPLGHYRHYTPNQFRRNGRWAQVCGRSPAKGSAQPNSKRVDVCLWTCEHGYACAIREAGITSYILINPPWCVQLSAGTSTRRQPWKRFTFISRELCDKSSSQRREGERPPARKVRCLQGRAGEVPPGRGAGVDGGRRTSCSCSWLFPCHPCSICWQEQYGASQHLPTGIHLLLWLPQPRFPPWPQFICRKGQGWEEQRLPQEQGGRTTLSFGSQDEELPSHELPSTFASNISRLQRSKLGIVHAAYLPSYLLAGNLISLLTCGQPNPRGSAPVSASAQETRVQLWKVFGGSRGTSACWFAAQHFARLLFWLYPHFFPMPTGFLRECAEGSSGLFKIRKQHGKLLPRTRLNGIANLTHSSLCEETQAGLRKLPCARQWDFLALALLALNGFSSCPALCYWEIICTWILLLFSIWEKNRVYPPVVLADGISFSSALEAVRWMGWAEVPHISRSLAEGRREASVRPIFTESLLSSGFPYSNKTIGGSGTILSTLPLYSDFICEFLQIIDDWDHYCSGK